MIERGLKVDTKDQRALRHGRDRYSGFSFETEYFQQMPMFFSAEGNSFPGLVGNYRGAHAFLICGGPSFGELNHGLLDHCWTMGINNSPRTYRPDAWCCVDDPTRFIKSIWLDPKILKFIPFDHQDKHLWDNDRKVWDYLKKEGSNDKARVYECPNAIYYRRNEKFEPKRWLWEYTFNWGDHSKWGGGRSVMLPALKILFTLGFRHVYLLGCDLYMDEQKKYHFEENRDGGAQNCNMKTYKKMMEIYYPKLKPQFDAVGFNIYNCNPDSRLTVFPYLSYEEATRRAKYRLGNIENELTQGMYKDPKKKIREADLFRQKLSEEDQK